MRPLALAPILVALTAALAHADPYLDATAAAARGDHATAVRELERAIAEDGWSVNALLGLGNAHASGGDHGRAILAYERARLLDPGDEAIATNLARVRESAGITVTPPSAVERAVGILPTDDWAWLALVGSAFACAGVLGLAWTRRRSAVSWTASVAGTVLAVAASGAAWDSAPDRDSAIVVASDSARIAPTNLAEVAFEARPGEHVEIGARRGDRVYVRADPARAGWLPASAVEPLVPTERPASPG